MTEEERKIEEFMQYDVYTIVVTLAQIGWIRIMMIETVNDSHQVKPFKYLNWVRWWFITLLMMYGNHVKRSIYLKIGFHLQFFAHMVLIYDFANCKLYDDMA